MGRAPEELPQVELIDPHDREVSSETAVSKRLPQRGRFGAAALAVALVAVLVATIVGGREEPEPDSDAGGDRSAQPATEGPSTTSAEAPDSGDPVTFLSGEPAPVFGDAVDALVLLGSADGGWRTLELDSGRIREVPTMAGVDPEQVHPVSGGVLIRRGQDTALDRVALPGGAVEPVRLELDTPELTRLRDLVSIAPDRYWATSWQYGGGPARQYATLVAADGSATAEAIRTPNADPVGGTVDGLVYNAGGRMFLVGAEDTTDLGPGVALAARDQQIAYVACEELAACTVVLRDLEDGSTVRAGRVPPEAATRGREGVTTALSGRGGSAVVPTRLVDVAWGRSGGVAATTLMITGPDLPLAAIDVESPKAGPVWLPDGSAVLMLAGRGLLHLELEGDRIVESIASGLRPQREAAIFVIPTGDPPSAEPDAPGR